jgi:hypothetical protein
VILATDRRIARRLREAGAINAAHAMDFDPPGPVGRARLHRMLSVGAVRETGANRYYLDETGFRAILAFMVVLIAILIVAGVVRVR